MSRRRNLVLMPLLLLAMPSPPATAQMATAAAGSTLDAATRREIVEAFARAMRDQYVFPERGELVASKITAALAEGKYNDVKTPAELASQLSAAASAVTHDKHLNVVSMGAPPPEGKPREMPSAEAGVTRADKLAGGVGYIEVVGFPELSFSKRVLDTAMSALSGSRSLIIDVRRNGGGDPEAVAYLVSFLIPPDRPINDIVSRTAKTTNLTRQSFRSVRTPVSFLKVPVYVLTSGDTFSGGEEFAYDVQALKRATLIGETTGGGANPVGPVDIGHGITALIPFGRAENPITKKNWEGVGVRPDVPVPANLALGAALTRAGLKPVAEIASASTERVFGPRTNPLPGSEAALRNLLAAIASGRTIQGIVVPQFASAVEAVLPRFRAELASLGALQSANFNKPDALGGDEYKLTFANGRRKMALVVRDDGKIVIASSLAPLSPGD